MLAAKALGRIGEQRDTEKLIQLLGDSQWWVRYRAAQALAKLPWINQESLERIQAEQTDRFAEDILEQVMAEGEYA
jgi:HEAT repeat protein